MSKLSVKHFELLTQGTHVSWNYTVKQKMHKMCLLLLWKSERRKNNCYLVFDHKKLKTKSFFFSNKMNIKHGWLLHRKPTLRSRNPKITGTILEVRMFWSKLCKSNWNSALNLAFPAFISPVVWNMCENLHYESRIYFKELYNDQENYRPTIYRAGAAVVSTITTS